MKPLWGTVLLALGSLPAAGRAEADSYARATLIEENDSFIARSDKHYTEGFRLAYLSPDLGPEDGVSKFFDDLDPLRFIPLDRPDQHSRRGLLAIGQSLFTPDAIQVFPPSPRDRPYAAWLYAEVAAIEESDGHRLDTFDIQLGVIGPPALGEQTQNLIHTLLFQPHAHGWEYQLHFEPGLDISYDLAWRFTWSPPIGGLLAGCGFDFIPEVGGTAGNIFTFAEGGAQLRFGRNLAVDYGQVHIRPSLSGTDYYNGDRAQGRLGYYVYAGIQTRFVARNIFLDGNTFGDSRSVTKKPVGIDYVGGASFFWVRGFRIDLAITSRDSEFIGQYDNDTYATIGLSIDFDPTPPKHRH